LGTEGVFHKDMEYTYNHAGMCAHVEIVIPGMADSGVHNSTCTVRFHYEEIKSMVSVQDPILRKNQGLPAGTLATLSSLGPLNSKNLV
jgi:hypothetical protein